MNGGQGAGRRAATGAEEGPSARHRMELALLRGLLRALRTGGPAAANRRAATAAEAILLRIPRLRRIGMDNLQQAYPERDVAWCEATLRGVARNLGRLAAEFARFEDLGPDNVREIVGFTSPESEANWAERSREGRAIIATGHFGNWELFAQAQGFLGAPIHLVHRPMKNRLVDDFITSVRGRAGTGVIYKWAAARGVLRLLKRGELVAIPIDQHATVATGGVPVPFFGRPAATTLGPARLAQIARVPIQVAVLVRRDDGLGHDILVRPPIDPPESKDPEALIETMARVTAEFEQIVRAHPEQWLWLHRRWRVDA